MCVRLEAALTDTDMLARHFVIDMLSLLTSVHHYKATSHIADFYVFLSLFLLAIRITQIL
jgi:hypothetical protein